MVYSLATHLRYLFQDNRTEGHQQGRRYQLKVRGSVIMTSVSKLPIANILVCFWKTMTLLCEQITVQKIGHLGLDTVHPITMENPYNKYK